MTDGNKQEKAVRAVIDSAAFQLQILDRVSQVLEDSNREQYPRILDYGSGEKAPRAGFFDLFGQEPEVVAYDPGIEGSARLPLYQGRVKLTYQEPIGERFDLLVFNFSLHHFGEPRKVLPPLAEKYKAPLILIIEYDYAEADEEEFAETFATGAEERELIGVFGGNIQRCYDFHRRFPLEAYKQALEETGYQILDEERGRGQARHKFFLLARR